MTKKILYNNDYSLNQIISNKKDRFPALVAILI